MDSYKWHQYADRALPWKAWLYRLEAAFLSAYERRIARTFDRLFVVSEQERDLFLMLLSVQAVPFLAEGMIAGLVGWLVASGLLIAVKSLWLNGLQSYFPYGVTLGTTDLIEVVIIAMITGLLICGSTSFLTLRRYLRV